jgi:hypothetical protein
MEGGGPGYAAGVRDPFFVGSIGGNAFTKL